MISDYYHKLYVNSAIFMFDLGNKMANNWYNMLVAISSQYKTRSFSMFSKYGGGIQVIQFKLLLYLKKILKFWIYSLRVSLVRKWVGAVFLGRLENIKLCKEFKSSGTYTILLISLLLSNKSWQNTRSKKSFAFWSEASY